MPPEKADEAWLWDMLDAARAISEFIADKTHDDYLANRMLRGAVERHIEIIGKAARHVSETFRQSHPEIPWRSIIGQRNVLAHDYGDIKHDLIWRVVTERVPTLIDMLQELVPEIPPETYP